MCQLKKYLKIPNAFEWAFAALCIWMIYLINADGFDAEKYEIIFKLFLSLVFAIMAISLFINLSTKTSALCGVIVISTFSIFIILFLMYELAFTGVYEYTLAGGKGFYLAAIINEIYNSFGVSGVIAVYTCMAIFLSYIIYQSYKKLPLNS